MSNKKSEQFDPFIVFYGMTKILDIFGIQEQFDWFVKMYMNDTKILGIIKEMPYLSVLFKISSV